MIIINLTENDVAIHATEIMALIKQSYKKSFPNERFKDSYFRERVMKAQAYINEGKTVIYGYIKEEKLVGFIWFFEKSSTIQTFLHINHFVVNENYRRLGVGKTLWKEVENYAEKREIEEIELMVTKENEAAVNFYKKMDFNIERYVMSKRLG